MQIEVAEAEPAERQVLANLLELYRYDFTEFDGRDIGEDGRYGYRYLDSYWSEAGRHPFLVRVDGRLAGFALLRQVAGPSGGLIMDVSEFFVMRRYRRLGVGQEMARILFDRFPGRWEVRELDGNAPAQAFWRRVIARHTGGRFEERQWRDGESRGVLQSFDNSGRDA